MEVASHLLSHRKNPEKSIKWKSHTVYGAMLQLFRYGVFGKPGEGPAIKDIGAGWAQSHGWRKKGEKAFFIEWAKVIKEVD